MAGFPVVDFAWAGSTHVPARSTYGPYTTARWEFIWGLEGSAEVRSGDQHFVFGVGSVQLTPPGIENHYRWTGGGRSSYGYAIFTGDPHPEWPRFRDGRTDDIVPQLLDHVLWLDTVRPEGWRESATGALSYALHAFVTGHAATQIDPSLDLPDAITRSLAAVRRAWDRDPQRALSLSDLAEAAGVSREHLARTYRRYTGSGPMTAIRTLRIARSAELLSHTNLSVAGVARATGFVSEFHFSRTFRATTGYSPSAFRRDADARFDLPIALRRLATQLPAPPVR
jgi:AraC-like DNA-binding protein